MSPISPSTGHDKRGAHHAASGLSITSTMCGGNIKVESLEDASQISLAIVPDPYCESDKKAHFQWFSYSVAGARGKPLCMHIQNAGEASYPSAWPGYEACASYDLEHWFRVGATSYDAESGRLSIRHVPECDQVSYAYYAPYPMDRHAQLVRRMQMRDGVQLEVLGQSLDGRNVDLLRVGADIPGQPPKRRVWLVARQHPGETQAEWFMEGLLERLTDAHDPVARALLGQCVFFCVPLMCPDGAARGHLRVNAAGRNLNREWASPDVHTAPEVFFVKAAMQREGLDLCVDVHADEELPYCFTAGLSGIPAWGPRLGDLEETFCSAFARASPDFQRVHGYPHDAPGEANLNLCSKQLGQLFDALSLTLEMPFKPLKNDSLPNVQEEWSPLRCKRLGGAMLNAILETAPKLR